MPRARISTCWRIWPAGETAPALDLGTGGGHVAYRLARHAEQVTATDLSADMLAAVAATAKADGLNNIDTMQAPAERLSFQDGVVRFPRLPLFGASLARFQAGLREARRVAKPEAPAVFIDAYAPGMALLDTHVQAVELLRDTSHVTQSPLAEWTAALGEAGFAVRALRTWQLRMDFPVWIARMRTPEDNVARHSRACKWRPRRKCARISPSSRTARSCSIS